MVVQADNSPESERLTKPTKASVSSLWEEEEGFGKSDI